MPSFDVVSELDLQEVRNAVDQADREITNRFDFKNTDSSIKLTDKMIELHSNTDQKLKALTQVLEEKMVKRQISLKSLDRGKIEEAAKGTVRQTLTLKTGIAEDKAKEIAKFIKSSGAKGLQAQIQGDQLRVTGKKKDDLQELITTLREHDFDVALQFTNFRD